MDWMSLFFGVSRAIAETTGAAGTTATADAAVADDKRKRTGRSGYASFFSLFSPAGG